MPSVGYVQRLQRVFAHFKKNGGVNRPACCAQIELLDEDDLTNWYVQLVYRRQTEQAAADSQVAGVANPEGDFVVNLHLRFLESLDDEPTATARQAPGSSADKPPRSQLFSSPSTHPSPPPPPSRMPLVFIHSPRLVAPFIHFGALCAWELMSQGSWSLTPLNMELLLIALHETLDPFALGSSVQVAAEGIGQGAVAGHGGTSTGSLAGVGRYSPQEHQEGIRYIRRAHPHLFREADPSSLADTDCMGTEAVTEDSEETLDQEDETAPSILSTAEALSAFFLTGPQGKPTARTTRHAGCLDADAIVRSLVAPDATTNHCPALSCSVWTVAPSSLGQPQALAFCPLCPTPPPQVQIATTVFVPHYFPEEPGDRLCLSLTGSGPARRDKERPSTVPSGPQLALVLRQAPNDASAAPQQHRQRQPRTQSPFVSSCIIREGCSITLRNVTVYGHLRVLGSLTLVNCRFVGSLVAERGARISLSASDVSLMVQDRLLLPLPAALSQQHGGPCPAEPPASEAEDPSLDVQANRTEGVLVLDSASVDVCDESVVSRGLPYFAREFPLGEDADTEALLKSAAVNKDAGEGSQATDSDKGTPGTSAGHRSRRHRPRPRFSLHHECTVQEQEEERMPHLRALFLVSNHARLRVSDSVVSPHHASRCHYTIMAENDALIDLCGVAIAAAQSSAITLQGCRGHCERVLVTSTDALLLVLHRKAHGLTNDRLCLLSNSGGETIAEAERRLFTTPQAPALLTERKSTGINVELGGVVTARYCLTQFVYFGFSAIAQSVASFHGCHAQHVVNGFTIDASTAHLGQCSTHATHVGVFVLNKAKCVLLSEEDVDAEGDSGSSGRDGDALNAGTQQADRVNEHDKEDDGEEGDEREEEAMGYGSYGARCRLIRHLTVGPQVGFATPQEAMQAFAAAAAAAAAAAGQGPQAAANAHDDITVETNTREDERLCFHLHSSRTQDVNGPVGLDSAAARRATRAAMAILQPLLTAITADINFPLARLLPFCALVGGELGLEVRDAVVEATGVLVVGPRDTGIFALAASEVTCSRVVVWHPRRPGTGTAPSSCVPDAERHEDDARSPRQNEKQAKDANEKATYGFSLRDRAALTATDCLVLGFTYASFTTQRSRTVAERCVGAGCLFGFVAAAESHLTLTHCGATATSGAVLAVEAATVAVRGEPHPVTDEGDTCQDPLAPAGPHRRLPRVLCGGTFLAVYRAGNTAMECRASTLHCHGAFILRADACGFNICENGHATLTNCLVDVSPSDAARFLLKGHPAHGRVSRRTRLLILDDEACFDSTNHPHGLPQPTDTRHITTCAVRTSAGSLCDASEVEVRFAACAFLTTGPESALAARRCRVRRVMTALHVEDGASAVAVRCRCHATYALVLLPHARCTLINGKYTAREVGFDNTGGLLRVLGHVKVLGPAPVGVRLEEDACLEAVERSALADKTMRAKATHEGSRGARHAFGLLDRAEAEGFDGAPTQLEIRLSGPVTRGAEVAGASAGVAPSDTPEDSTRGPLSPASPLPPQLPPPWEASTATEASPTTASSSARSTRPDYPVCLLLKGGCTAALHNALFAREPSDNNRPPQEGTQNQKERYHNAESGGEGEAALCYGVRAVGHARASLTGCRFEPCFREACVRIGAGAHVTLEACVVLGRGTLVADPAEKGATAGAWYALEVHRGASCVVTGSAATQQDRPCRGPTVSPLRRGPPLARSAQLPWSWGSLVHRGLQAVRGLWQRGGTFFAAVTTSAVGRLLGPWLSREGGTEGGAVQPTGNLPRHRVLTPMERWMMMWMKSTHHSVWCATSDPSASAPSRETSFIQGRCLVTGRLTADCTVFAVHRPGSTGATAEGLPSSPPSTPPPALAVQLDVAKGGSITATRCMFDVSDFLETDSLPVVFARHTGTMVELTACLVTSCCRTETNTQRSSRDRQEGDASPSLCLLRVGSGAAARVALVTSSFPGSPLHQPVFFPYMTGDGNDVTALHAREGVAPSSPSTGSILGVPNPLLSYHVAPEGQLRLDACVLSSVVLLTPSQTQADSAEATATFPTRGIADVAHCFFCASRANVMAAMKVSAAPMGHDRPSFLVDTATCRFLNE